MRYEPMNPIMARERGDYAYAKWNAMDDEHKEYLRPHINRLMRIPHIGEMGAVELLFTLGTYLNVNEREK